MDKPKFVPQWANESLVSQVKSEKFLKMGVLKRREGNGKGKEHPGYASQQLKIRKESERQR